MLWSIINLLLLEAGNYMVLVKKKSISCISIKKIDWAQSISWLTARIKINCTTVFIISVSFYCFLEQWWQPHDASRFLYIRDVMLFFVL